MKKQTKRKTPKKIKIKDPPMASKIQQGSVASKGPTDYHYQYYENFSLFMSRIPQKQRKLICHKKELYLRVLLQRHLTIKPKQGTTNQFFDRLHDCLQTNKRLIPIVVEINVEREPKTHANLIIIDTEAQHIELFEPHGYSSDKSHLEDVSRAYVKIARALRSFFKKDLPTYKVIEIRKYLRCPSFQGKVDAYSGLCIPWSILYLHYRLLNPSVPPKKLVTYLHKTVTKRKLLRHSHHVERLLKRSNLIPT